MIDFALQPDLTAKTQESAQKSNEQMVELFAQEGVDLKAEFSKALQELEAKGVEGEKVHSLLENVQTELENSEGDGKKASAQLSALFALLSQDDSAAQGLNPEKGMVADQPKNLGQLELLLKNSQHKNLTIDSVQDEAAPVEQKLSAEDAKVLSKKMNVHELLLDKQEGAIPLKQMGQNKNIAQKPVMIGGDDFLQQKVLLEKNNLVKVDGEQVTAQKLIPQAQAQSSLKQYGNEQSLLDNRMFSMKAGASEGEIKSIGSNLGAEEAALLGEVSNGSEKMLLREAVQATRNETQVDLSTATKVLDLSKIDVTKTNELITKITEYIEQSQFEKTQKLDLVVKHDQLGHFKLQVNKTGAGSNLIDLKIQSSNAEAHKFFTDNEVGLLQSLSKSGIKVADLKISTGFDSQTLGQQSSQDSKGQSENGQKSLFSQDQKSQDQRDAQKRRDLWDEYRERQSA